MRSFTFLLAAASLFDLSVAGYALEDDYMTDFYGAFDFFTAPDPTNGFVKYVDEATARQTNLINASTTVPVEWGVDSTNETPEGRPSLRLVSKKKYNAGLVVMDVAHMPTGCGTWPAFWMVGPDWPTGGEIDILEGVNEQTNNGMTLHTAPNCKIGPDTSIFAGEVTTPNCDVNAKGQDKNVGCSIEHPSKDSFGTGLNAIGGGVYATQWTAEAISVWYFPRGAIPEDVLGDAPSPAGWGIPAAKFTGGCDIENMFKEQQIVFNTAFCGDWAGAVWETGSCAKKAATCDEYVQNNPEAFKDAYWTVNALKVYQDNGNDTPAPSPSGAPAESTVISEPVSVPTGNASVPAISSGYATIPSEIPTSAPILSFSEGTYVLPTISASGELPAETSAPVAEPTPSAGIPTSEALQPSKTKSASSKPTAPTSAAASSKPATPTQPAGPGDMPGFQWPGMNGTRPAEAPTRPTAAPPNDMSLPVQDLPSASAPPAQPTRQPEDASPPIVPTDAEPAPAAPTKTGAAGEQKTVYQTVYVTVRPGAEVTPAAGLSNKAARYMREHRRRAAGHGHARM
ncbi:concanavalin A-like lectin/glucanase domain-containing protein [Boeremia exigua]|uniref:concanavalin A-like lectin/glucanase domain-containing protein n=1 Tax=Boeremia exigua TaxID=749465 RepID=UPI001E8E442C|nr:concanavalin A-like lectin/glucanase domain-containing protein [Boeremia exigua]KAH6637871.1 concanavalin A-like lectin/glucanase domain-containing protein [Boeremia exigua]